MKLQKSLLLIFIVALMNSSCGLMDKFKSASDTDENMSVDKQDEMAENTPDEEKTDNNIDGAFFGKKEQVAETREEPSSEEHFKLSESKPVEHEEKIEPVMIQPSKHEVMVSDTEIDWINYKVKKGDTLMQIAFKLYGDVGRWKEIQANNASKLKSQPHLNSHMTLKVRKPEREFVWQPEGLPYLIQKNDTLGIVSNNVYSTPKFWKEIWKNNEPLIKNPNVIFAGFTIYYKEKNGFAPLAKTNSATDERTPANQPSDN